MPLPSNKQFMLEIILVPAQHFTPPEVPAENLLDRQLPPLKGNICLGA
jgi:hypothetical protein